MPHDDPRCAILPMRYSHPFLTALSLRAKCLLPEQPNDWDHAAYRAIGLDLPRVDHNGMCERMLPRIQTTHFDFARFEAEGRSPLCLWTDLLALPPYARPTLDDAIVGYWGTRLDEARCATSNTKNSGPANSLLDMFCSPPRLRTTSWILFSAHARASGIFHPSPDAPEAELARIDEAYRRLLIPAAESGTHDVREVEEWHETAIAEDDQEESNHLIHLLAMARHARREAEAYLGAEHTSLNSNKKWTRSLETAFLTEWLYAFGSSPLDWAPAVLAYSKSLEMMAADAWQVSILEVVPKSTSDEIRSRGRIRSRSDGDIQWPWNPDLGTLCDLLATGHALNLAAGRPSQILRIAEASRFSDWIDHRALQNRLDRWDNLYARWRNCKHQPHEEVMMLAQMRMAHRLHEASKNRMWQDGLSTMLVAMDAFRHSFRNGAAHSDIMTITDTRVARSILLGPFQMYLWPEVPLFHSDKSLLGPFLPPRHRELCERHMTIRRDPPSLLRERFLDRWPTTESWLLDTKTPQRATLPTLLDFGAGLDESGQVESGDDTPF
jgi:hypothetical protein